MRIQREHTCINTRPDIQQFLHKIIVIVIAAGSVHLCLKGGGNYVVPGWASKIPREWETSQISLIYLQSLSSFNNHLLSSYYEPGALLYKVSPVMELTFKHVSYRWI